MKPQLLKVNAGPAYSFSVRQDQVPYINNRWHYHQEIELIHFREGSGIQFIGDSIKPFQSGDVLLLGPEIPHYWNFADHYFKDDCIQKPDVRVAHFQEYFWGKDFLDLPENQPVKKMLQEARRGIQLHGKTRETVAALLEQMLAAPRSRRILLLIEALFIIAESQEISLLSSIGFQPQFKESGDDRIDAIHQFSLQHYRKKIQIEEIAAIANMSRNSFCRFFKTKTGKTYTEFLTEIKVGVACRLLLENRLGIKQICYESGFHNFASFHKSFKQITKKTPLQYQREYVKKKAPALANNPAT